MAARKTATSAAAAKAKSRRPRKPRAPKPWWGDEGPAPHIVYPGVTIEIPAIWDRLSGLRKVTRDGHIVGWTAGGVDIPEWWAKDGGRWVHPTGRFFFDREKADHACDFFPTFLRHHIGEFAGQPFDLLHYQGVLLTRPLFGWKQTATGLRRFRKVFAFLPKGAGKSPWASGTGIYLTMCDDEPAAEVYALANDIKQARIVHGNAKIMVEESPDLEERCDVLRDAIYHRDTRSTYQVLSSEATGAHGFRPHGIIFDEFHGQANRDLYEALKKSMPKRRQPVLIIVTHAGDDDEGICYEEYEGAKRVLSGTAQEDGFLPVIFEASAADNWKDPAVWKRVNPGHGVTIKHEGIVSECQEAEHEPRKLNDFLRFHLNRWVGQAVAWLPLDWWDACDTPVAPDAVLAELPCAAGLDMAQKIDLAAFVLAFRHQLPGAQAVEVVTGDGGPAIKRSLNYRITLLPFFWIPEDTMREREKEDGIPYAQWVKAGLVTATEGVTIDYDRVHEDIVDRIAPRFPRLKGGGEIGYDPAFATDIANRLRTSGFTTLEILQNYPHMSEPCYLLEGLIKAGRVSHGGHRTLRNHVENVAVKKDAAGRLRPVKPRQTKKRIDGVVASLMGLSRLAIIPDVVKRSRYATRGAPTITGDGRIIDGLTGKEITLGPPPRTSDP